MKIQSDPDLHLSYCLNIHPGERMEDVFASIQNYASRVKSAVCPKEKFGLGLRLGAQAVDEMGMEGAVRLRDQLESSGMYVFTVNGFPYGGFHGGPVKENVYAPDWRDERRSEYTKKLVSILAELLPAGVAGSISTVPVSYAKWIRSEADLQHAVSNLVDVVIHCLNVERETGSVVRIALEPEPDCYLQRTGDVSGFFKKYIFKEGAALLGRTEALSADDAEGLLRKYLGVCFDTCHAAVQFEDVVESLRAVKSEGIGIFKVQISSAVEVKGSSGVRSRLKDFVDEVYLHQTRVRDEEGNVVEYPDLDMKVIDSFKDGQELRTHFHVPLWLDEYEGISGTASRLPESFFRLLRSGLTSHIEAETYTFDVLPRSLVSLDVVENVVRELEWIQKRLAVIS